MTTGRLLTSAWTFDPVVLGSLALGVVAWGVYFGRDGSRRVGWFIAAVLALCASLLSPVAVLADGILFSAHMAQHLLLLLVVPPLFLLSLPATAARARPGGPARARLSPGQAWILGVGAMWFWHEPTLCNAATSIPTVHAVQSLSLLIMGVAFWWPILSPRAEQRIAPLVGALYLFAACGACTALGIVVTFSPVTICSAYAHPTDPRGLLPLVRQRWGLTSAADQRVGGLLMWVPACLIYGIAILSLLARWYAAEPRARLA